MSSVTQRGMFLAMVAVYGVATTNARATIISNGSFEDYRVPLPIAHEYNPPDASWDFNQRSGILFNNGRTFDPPFGAFPDGTQAGILQYAPFPDEPGRSPVGEFSQNVTLPMDGTYSLSYQVAGRHGSSPRPYDGNLSYAVFLDGSQILSDATTTYQPFTGKNVDFSATAGDHTLAFRATSTSGDHTGFFDAVELVGPRHLVVVTHGWRPTSTTNIGWIYDMKEHIVQRLKSLHPDATVRGDLTWREGADPPMEPGDSSDFDVVAFEWRDGAHRWTPWQAADTARQLGQQIGIFIGNGDYDSVHFIGHSAGSWLVDAATTAVEAADSTIDTHVTFLDAFGRNGRLSGGLGAKANWAEHYVTQRGLFGGDAPWTGYTLEEAYNLDITSLGPGASSWHGWPVEWYDNSVQPGEAPQDYGWGFPRAAEYAGFSPNHDEFRKGVRINLETGELMAAIGESLEFQDIQIDEGLAEVSETGTVEFLASGGFAMTTGSPVWVSAELHTADPINLLEFNYDFPSEAEGVLSVFFEDQQIFGDWESESPAGIQDTDLVWLGDDCGPGTYTLRFQLDPTTELPSSIEITDIRLGLYSTFLVPEPSTLVLLSMGAFALTVGWWRRRWAR